MKKIILALIFLSANLFAQNFTVEKVSGKVFVQKGTDESWIEVKSGENLTGNDLVVTDSKSYVQLNKDGNRFLIGSNSALGLSHIKKVSTNDLLLALAMEEIRNVPKIKNEGKAKSTAVYGADKSAKVPLVVSENKLGLKKINGAKLLAENGYEKSAVIVAKETYRKYPDTQRLIEDRIYFADILSNLGLYQEAAAEYANIENEPLNSTEKAELEKRIKEVNTKLAK